MKKTKWALIGCGKVVLKNKTTPFINSKNTIQCICTTNKEHSNQAIKKLKLKHCNAYDNVTTMLNNESIDAIYICTPPKFHYEYLKILVHYNIPIYVEKPFVISKKEAQEIAKLYNKNKNILFIAHYKRLTPKIQKLKNLLIKEKIGTITKIEGIFNRTFNHDLLTSSWIYNKEISGGGRFFDIAPHIIDIIYYLFGELKNIKSKVTYETKLHICENTVNTSFNINHIKCTLNFDLIAKEDEDKIIIYGTKGYIITSINRNKPIDIYNQKNKLIHRYKFPQTKTWGIEAIKEFNKYIKKRNYHSHLCDVNQALLIQTYIENILKK